MTVGWLRSHREAAPGLMEPASAAAGAWRARPYLAATISLTLLLAPLAVGLVCAWMVAAALPPTSGLWPGVGSWLAVLTASLVAVWLTSRLARRALPLPMLLRLALVFPDRAPARYRIAARAGVTRRLAERVAAAHEAGIDDEPTQAAERILTLLAALAAHDPKTRGHCERVRAYNDLLTEAMGLPEPARDRLRWAALIHDIGKLDVPARVLNKPARLDLVELELVRHHPLRGLVIAAPLAAWLGSWASGIDQHHERFDGSGYPYGLAGEAIGLGARIVAVADTFEVMTAPRPYSRAVSARSAREELVRCAGTQFDPQIVRAFLDISIGRLRWVIGPLGWLASVPFLARRFRFANRMLGGAPHLATLAVGAIGAAVIAAAALPSPPQVTPAPRPTSTPFAAATPSAAASAGRVLAADTAPSGLALRHLPPAYAALIALSPSPQVSGPVTSRPRPTPPTATSTFTEPTSQPSPQPLGTQPSGTQPVSRRHRTHPSHPAHPPFPTHPPSPTHPPFPTHPAPASPPALPSHPAPPAPLPNHPLPSIGPGAVIR
ncbi:MAG: HD-GYP domain-containing protein [Mycobacteriales bacterium]